MKYYYYKYKLRYYEFAIIFLMRFDKWKLVSKFVEIRKNIMLEIRKHI